MQGSSPSATYGRTGRSIADFQISVNRGIAARQVAIVMRFAVSEIRLRSLLIISPFIRVMINIVCKDKNIIYLQGTGAFLPLWRSEQWYGRGISSADDNNVPVSLHSSF